MNLAITIAVVNDTDYNDAPVTVKQLTATFDGAPVSMTHCEDSAVADATAKANFRAVLTAKGYTWDSEV